MTEMDKRCAFLAFGFWLAGLLMGMLVVAVVFM